jgi:hypothetical protein
MNHRKRRLGIPKTHLCQRSPSLALLLAACATAPNPFRDAAAIEEQIATAFRKDPDDAETMARLAPRQLSREGRTLVVRAGARTYRFTDEGYCEGFGTCERYRADRLMHGRYLGVRLFHGEYPDSYFIIDLARGSRLFDTGERPVPAPVAPLAAVADGGEINEPIIGGLAVVDLARRRVLWHEPGWYLEAAIEGWDGPRCVRARYRPGHRGEGHPLRTIWIAQTGGRWAAHETRPASCNG